MSYLYPYPPYPPAYPIQYPYPPIDPAYMMYWMLQWITYPYYYALTLEMYKAMIETWKKTLEAFMKTLEQKTS